MNRLVLLAATAAALAIPATALAANPTGPDRENAARYCKAQQGTMSAADFKSLYAPNGPQSSAFGRCVAKFAQAQVTNRVNAARACRAEQNDPNFASSHDGKTFQQFYGPGRNAFGRCVASKAKQSGDAQQQQTLNASRRCKAERAADVTAFNTKYGGRANAFGRCVSNRLP